MISSLRKYYPNFTTRSIYFRFLFHFVFIISFAGCATYSFPEGFEEQADEILLTMDLMDENIQWLNNWVNDTLTKYDMLEAQIQNMEYKIQDNYLIFNPNDFLRETDTKPVLEFSSFVNENKTSELKTHFNIPYITDIKKNHAISDVELFLNKNNDEIVSVLEKLMIRGGYATKEDRRFHYFPKFENDTLTGWFILTEPENISTSGETIEPRWYNTSNQYDSNSEHLHRMMLFAIEYNYESIQSYKQGTQPRIIKDIFKNLKSFPSTFPSNVLMPDEIENVELKIGVYEFLKKVNSPIAIPYNTGLSVYNHLYKIGLLGDIVDIKNGGV